MREVLAFPLHGSNRPFGSANSGGPSPPRESPSVNRVRRLDPRRATPPRLIWLKAGTSSLNHNEHMSAPLLFRCPSTGLMSRAAVPSEWRSSTSALEYRAVDCPACKRMHLINPTTGALLVDEERQRKVQRCGTRAIGISPGRPSAVNRALH